LVELVMAHPKDRSVAGKTMPQAVMDGHLRVDENSNTCLVPVRGGDPDKMARVGSLAGSCPRARG
jgi:hypothetical protein